jgi:hypothetical protein
MVLASRIAAEWAKPSFSGGKRTNRDEADATKGNSATPSAAKKRKAEKYPTDPHDWRYPLFFWKGTLSKSESDPKSILWQGKWVAGVDSLPSAEEYQVEGKDNSFSLNGTLDAELPQLESLENLAGKNGRLVGSYQLDQGDGNGHQCVCYLTQR